MPSSDNATTFQVAGVVSFYMSAALIMVFVNKAVLNSSPELPLLFLLIQLILAVILLHTAAAVSRKVEIPVLDVQVAKKLVPVVLVNVVGLVFNTLCLRDVEASFFQIARGLVLPLTIVVSSIHTRSAPQKKILLAAAIVTIGFLLGVAPSASVPVNVAPSLVSLLYGVFSSLFIALHAVLIKSSLGYCHNSTIQLAYWTNAGSVVFLAPFVLLHGEIGTLQMLIAEENWNGSIFFWGTMITGVCGFLLCIAGLLSIKVTSPITHMFSSAARSVFQTLLGVWIFGDILTVNRVTSIFTILVGTMYYTWVKSGPSPPPYRSVDLEAVRGDKENIKERDVNSSHCGTDQKEAGTGSR
jgi:GDP-fucose transporter C1